MRQEGALWGPQPASESGREEALRLLDESSRLLLGILTAVAMQIRSLELERCRLLGGGAQGLEDLQLGASLLSVWALAGFSRQAGERDDQCDKTLGLTSLTIGLIRLMRLLYPESAAREEAAELTQPDF